MLSLCFEWDDKNDNCEQHFVEEPAFINNYLLQLLRKPNFSCHGMYVKLYIRS